MNVKSLALTGVFVALLGGVVAQERLSDGTVNGSSAINQNAILELASRNKGILHTRVALEMTTKANPMQAHVAGLMVYNTETKNDVVPGIYYNDGTKWVLASGGKATSISYNPETYEISFIDINGNPVKLDFRKIVQSNQTITTLVDNKNGTYVYTSESGVQTIINVTADVTNTFEQIINNEKVKNEFITLIKNTGGNVYYKDEKFTFLTKDGEVKEILLKELVESNETLTALSYLPGSNQLTYQDEKGAPHVLDLGTGSLAYNDKSNMLSYVDAKGKVTDLNLNKTNLAYNPEKNTLDYTNSNGVVQTVTLADMVHKNETLTALSYLPGSNQLTYQDEKGTPHTFDLGIGSLAYNDKTNMLSYVDAKGKATDLSLNNTNLAYNPEKNTLDYTNSNGVVQTVTLADMVHKNETLTVLSYLPGFNQLTYQDEKGTPHTFDLGTGSLAYNDKSNMLSYVDAKGKVTGLNLNNTNLAYNPEKNTLDYTNSNGVVQTVTLADMVHKNETLTVLSYLPGSNQLTYQDEKGTPHTFDLGTGSLAYNDKSNMLSYVDAKGKATGLNLNNTNLTYNPEKNTLDYTNSNGVVQTVTLADMVHKNETLTVLSYLPGSNQLTYQDEKGTPHTFDLGTGSLAYNDKSNMLSYVDAKGKATGLNLNNTNLTYNPEKNTLDYTNSNGVVQTVTLADMVHKNETLTVLSYLPGSNQLTYQDEKGTPHTFDLGTGSLAYNDKSNMLSYVDAKGKATGLNLNNTNLTYNPEKNTLDYTNSNGVVQTVTLADMVHKNETLTVLSYLPGSNQLTYQDEKGTPHTFDLGTGSLAYNDKTNMLSYVDAKGKATGLNLNNTNLTYNPEKNTLDYTNSNGVVQTVTLADMVHKNETLTVLSYLPGSNQLTYQDEKGTPHTFDLGTGSLAYNDKSNMLSYVDAKGKATGLNLNNTNLAYNPEKNTLDYTNSNGVVQSVSLPNETVTTLKQDALGLKYKNEKDAELTAKIVSANEKNIIKVAEDFGAVLTAQEIQFNQEKTIVLAGTGVKVDTKVKGNEVEYTVSIGEDVIKELKAVMPKFFYMPSMVMPTSEDQIADPSIITESGGVFTVRLYDSYKKQFGMSDPSSSVSSPDVTTILPVLPATELDYYVTFYDKTVFTEVKLLQGGILTYKIASDADVTLGSFMNVVFAVKP